MNRREFLRTAAAGAAALAVRPLWAMQTPSPRTPNIVFILADDLGYTDLGCYGATQIKTPHLDALAKQGMRFTDFHCPAGVCTPTRAALMTGCYPKRVSLHVGVLGPTAKTGLNPEEVTIAELLRERGYATACIGKWHLGLEPQFLPTRQGFDSYFGMPGPNHGKSDLYRDEECIAKNADVDYDTLTQRYTDEAVQFIKKNKARPFFLYLPHSAPHVPLFASKEFRGKSAAGLYGDMIEEVDWSCGRILETLKEEGLEKDTLVIFTSDNGQANTAAPPLHGGKGSTWEAGFRVPCIARWPGHIPADTVCTAFASMMDWMPTLAPLAGASAPHDRVIDGHDIMPLLLADRNARSPYDVFLYYGRDGSLCAIREGKWKLHLIEPSERWFGKLPKEALLDTKPATPLPWLYNLDTDIGETKNVAAEHPDIVKKLTDVAQSFDEKITAEQRPVGRLTSN